MDAWKTMEAQTPSNSPRPGPDVKEPPKSEQHKVCSCTEQKMRSILGRITVGAARILDSPSSKKIRDQQKAVLVAARDDTTSVTREHNHKHTEGSCLSKNLYKTARACVLKNLDETVRTAAVQEKRRVDTKSKRENT